MHKIYVSLAIAVIAFSPGVQPQNPGDSQIRAIVAAQVTAWNAGDGAAYAKDVGARVKRTLCGVEALILHRMVRQPRGRLN